MSCSREVSLSERGETVPSPILPEVRTTVFTSIFQKTGVESSSCVPRPLAHCRTLRRASDPWCRTERGRNLGLQDPGSRSTELRRADAATVGAALLQVKRRCGGACFVPLWRLVLQAVDGPLGTSLGFPHCAPGVSGRKNAPAPGKQTRTVLPPVKWVQPSDQTSPPFAAGMRPTLFEGLLPAGHLTVYTAKSWCFFISLTSLRGGALTSTPWLVDLWVCSCSCLQSPPPHRKACYAVAGIPQSWIAALS